MTQSSLDARPLYDAIDVLKSKLWSSNSSVKIPKDDMATEQLISNAIEFANTHYQVWEPTRKFIWDFRHLLQEYRNRQNGIYKNTQSAVDWLRNQTWWVRSDIESPVSSTPPPAFVLNTQEFQTLANQLATQRNEPLTIARINQYLSIIREESLNPSLQAEVLGMICVKLFQAGFISYIRNGQIQVEWPHGKTKEATDFRATLEAWRQGGHFHLDDMRRALVMSQASWNDYMGTQQLNVQNVSMQAYLEYVLKRSNISLQWVNSIEEKAEVIRKASWLSPEIRSLLLTYVYDTDNIQKTNMNDIVALSEERKKVVASQPHVQTRVQEALQAAQTQLPPSAAAWIQHEQQRMAERNEPLTLERFLDNPLRAVGAYPITSFAIMVVLVATIGWKKAFYVAWGSALGVLVSKETGLQDFIKQSLMDAFGVSTNRNVPSPPRHTPNTPLAAPKDIDYTGLTPAQHDATKVVVANSQIVNIVNQLRERSYNNQGSTTGDLSDYMRHINHDMANMKIVDLVNPQNFDHSIFADKSVFPWRPLATNLNNVTLKMILRIYLTWTHEITKPQQGKRWEPEQKAFIEQHQSLLQQNPNLTLKDFMTQTQQSWSTSTTVT